MSLSEKLMKEETELKESFNSALSSSPERAQAIAMYGIYHILNTLTRVVIHLANDVTDMEIT